MSFTVGQRVKLKSSPYGRPKEGDKGTIEAVYEQTLVTHVIVDWDGLGVRPMYGHELEAL